MKSSIRTVCVWSFILIKLWGTAFATWSAWWVLIPFVPVLGLILQRIGLL